MCSLPKLPQHKELLSQLSPFHARLANERSIARKHPVHRCNEVQVFLVPILKDLSHTHAILEK